MKMGRDYPFIIILVFSKNSAGYWPESTKEAACGPFVITNQHESTEDIQTTRDLMCRIKVTKKQQIRRVVITYFLAMTHKYQKLNMILII